MADLVLNLKDGKKAERKLFATYVNVGTSEEKDWQIVGKGVEESAVEFNFETETVKDILGLTETTITTSAPQQDLEPSTVRAGSKLHEKLLTLISLNDTSAFSTFEVMQAWGFVGEEGQLYAEVHKNCTVVPTSLGGSANVDMPISIYFSNDKEVGTVDAISNSPTFSPAVPVI